MKKIKLGSIADIQIGKTPSRANLEFWGEGVEWLSIADLNHLIDGKYIAKASEQITEKAIQKTGPKLIPENTILYSFKLSIGKIAITKKPFYTNEAIAALTIKPGSLISIDYLFYALKSLKSDYKTDHGAKGITLNKKSLANLVINLPELNDQNKIVVLLDKIQRLITKREEAIELCDQIIKSTFLELFGDPISNKKNFTKAKLSQIGDWQSGGTPSRSKAQYFEGSIPWYSSGELNDVFISKSKESITVEALEKTSARKVEKNSLLIGMYDTAALKSSITIVDCSCNQAIAFAKLNNKRAISLFVYFAVQLSKDYYLSKRRGARQKNLNLSIIKNIEIPLPDIGLQKSFAKKTMLQLKIKGNLKLSRENNETTFQSIMQKSFSGADFISEEQVFEDLLKGFQLKDFIEKEERVKYLANLINRNGMQDWKNYEKAKAFAFQLLQMPQIGLKQDYNSLRKKIELTIEK